MSLRSIEPINGQCPEGYEYVRGHTEKNGVRVRAFCRRKPLWQRRIDRQIRKVDYAMDQWEEKFNGGEDK